MTDESAQKRWTRRGLLGGAFASALAAGGLTFGGFSFASEKAERLPAEADVVVVGSGIAGLSAAVAAREAGAKRVLLLEKGSLAGGHSIYSSGSISVVSRKLQGPKGFQDSPEIFARDSYAFGDNCGDLEILERIGAESESALRWLSSMGVRFGGLFTARAETRPRCVSSYGNSAGRSYVLALMTRADALGVDVLLEADLRALDRVPDDSGWRLGVRLSDLPVLQYLRARAVVLAAGGFGACREMRMKVMPELDPQMQTSANPFGTLWENREATAAELARNAGGFWKEGFGLQLLPYWGGRLIDYAGGDIFITLRGRRFIDEGLAWNKISAAVLRQPEKEIWVITDSASRKSATLGLKIANGFVKKSDTVEEMAAGMGIPAAVLKETLDTYNRAARTGFDPEFGKTIFTQTLDHPPYYWGRERIFVHTSFDGIATDREARVIDERGIPIPGLYAAGEFAGGIFGRDRLGGAGISNCLVMGRAAGRNAALF